MHTKKNILCKVLFFILSSLINPVVGMDKSQPLSQLSKKKNKNHNRKRLRAKLNKQKELYAEGVLFCAVMDKTGLLNKKLPKDIRNRLADLLMNSAEMENFINWCAGEEEITKREVVLLPKKPIKMIAQYARSHEQQQQFIAGLSEDNTISVWKLDSGQFVNDINVTDAHSTPVKELWLADNFLFVLKKNDVVSIFDILSKQQILAEKSHLSDTSIAVMKSDEYFVHGKSCCYPFATANIYKKKVGAEITDEYTISNWGSRRKLEISADGQYMIDDQGCSPHIYSPSQKRYLGCPEGYWGKISPEKIAFGIIGRDERPCIFNIENNQYYHSQNKGLGSLKECMFGECKRINDQLFAVYLRERLYSDKCYSCLKFIELINPEENKLTSSVNHTLPKSNNKNNYVYKIIKSKELDWHKALYSSMEISNNCVILLDNEKNIVVYKLYKNTDQVKSFFKGGLSLAQALLMTFLDKLNKQKTEIQLPPCLQQTYDVLLKVIRNKFDAAVAASLESRLNQNVILPKNIS